MPAILCALTPALCALVIRPGVETGISDDWSYIKTVQVLAQSGHIVYNGWATAMLGWQLYLGALFVKLFGFSFTVVRSSTLIVAMAIAFLLQRTFVRAGIGQWNAALATLTLVLSPLFMPLAFMFMSDLSGLFCIVLCLYMCLRTLQAATLRSTIAWISFAALLNAIGGTARQISWLGVLVMVPSTLWLLRRKPRVLLIGGIANLAGIGIVFASMHWFSQQPYSLPEPLIPNAVNFKSLENVVANFLRGGAEVTFLSLPVLLMFVAILAKARQKMIAWFAAGSLFVVLVGLFMFHHHGPEHWLAPFFGDYLSALGVVDAYSILGDRPVILQLGIRVLLTVATMIGLLGLLTVVFGGLPKLPSLPGSVASLSWRQLGIVVLPFSLAYIALLIPRAVVSRAADRYFLPLMMLALLVLARYFQENVRPNLPLASLFVVGIFAAFGIAATHDMFAMYRGYLAAIQEIRSSGLPATSFKGGWEYDGWTELEKDGYINDDRIRIPRGAYVPQPVTVFPAGCNGDFLDHTPAVKPLYALSFDPWRCNGPAGFPPVTYTTWLAPHATSIYIVKYPALSDR